MKYYAIFATSKGRKDLFRVVTSPEDAVNETAFYKAYEMNQAVNYIAYESNDKGWFEMKKPYCKNGEIINKKGAQ